MSVFKTVNSRVFIESLYRMYPLEKDMYLTWVHEGKYDEAPLTSEYVIEKVKHTKSISGSSISIKDGINMEVESFIMHGKTTVSGASTMTSPKTLTCVGTYNSNSKMWNITCTDGKITNAISTIQPLCKLQNGVEDIYRNDRVRYRTQYETLSADSNWTLDNVYTNDNVLVVSWYISSAKENSTDIWCTHFQASDDLTKPNHIKLMDRRLYLTIDTKVCQNLDLFIKWLKKNTVVCIFEREYEAEQMIEPYILLYTYEGTTNITNNQNALMDVEYRISPNARLWQRQSDGSFKEITS